MIDDTLIAVLVEQALLLVATVATLRSSSKDVKRRVGKLEEKDEKLDDAFVPRRELEEIVRGIEKQTTHTNSLVQALIYAGCDRKVALEAIEAADAAGSSAADLAWLEPYLQTTLPKFEGRIPFFYLDTRGNVTIGSGTLVPNAAAAMRLPLHDRYGAPASPQAIVADFRRVAQMQPGRLAVFYRCATSPLLSPDEALEIDRELCLGFLAELRQEFTGFDGFPVGARLGLLDMVVNMGIGRAPHGDEKGDGLLAFTHLCADVRARNWEGCANSCARDAHLASFDTRNAWTRTQFLSGAFSAGQHGGPA